MLPFHPEPDNDSERVEADPILIEPELSRVSEAHDEQLREPIFAQTEMAFDDLDSVELSQDSVSTTTFLAYLDRTETQIVNLLQSNRDLGCLARMALYYRDKLFHSNELSPLLSLFRKSFLGSIINVY